MTRLCSTVQALVNLHVYMMKWQLNVLKTCQHEQTEEFL